MPYPAVGAARAVIASVADAEERARYRVRVYGCHDEGMPVEHLPWAETCPIGGAGWGDIPPWEVGDKVIVIPEMGNREYWFIIGGWISSPQGGTDLPPEMSGDYEEDRLRWCRIDRMGNMIEMSSKPDELHVRIKSGNASILVTQVDDSVVIDASGPLKINAQKASVTSEVTDVQSPLVNIVGQGVDDFGVETGRVQIFSNKDMDIFAGVGAVTPTQDGKGFMRVGQYKDDSLTPRQTNEMYIGPKVAQIGKEELAAGLTSDGYLHTDEIAMEATTKVSIKSTNGSVQIDVKDATINVTNDATINVDNNADLTVGGDLTMDATGKATVKGANIDIDSTGSVKVLNAGSIELGSAPLGDIVTTLHPCAFTGAPHPFGSSVAKAQQ